jgi:hypothetical protein
MVLLSKSASDTRANFLKLAVALDKMVWVSRAFSSVFAQCWQPLSQWVVTANDLRGFLTRRSTGRAG